MTQKKEVIEKVEQVSREEFEEVLIFKLRKAIAIYNSIADEISSLKGTWNNHEIDAILFNLVYTKNEKGIYQYYKVGRKQKIGFIQEED